ncbi:zona pellucida sperm-binding protein 3 [Brienomyrus brachyistius]|uniref:zona pellucida sperm-binding protein 3 n=1 Tax=Brienomyrus brachyistius TaxID=42636 RepID=UPI0020B1D0C3|nr:zona pellucida sperm-binding protein 3 [Brienomyrus brachyistius]
MPLNLPVSMPAVGSMVLPMDVFKPAQGSRLLPDMVKNILRPPLLPPPTTQKMVEVQCRAGRIVVRVLRELLGLPNAQQDLSLGTCQVNKVTPLHFYFDYNLRSCNTMRKSFKDRTEYSNTLCYAPEFSGPVVRAMPFKIPLQCVYYRFFNSYKAGYRPCPKGTTQFKSLNLPSGITLTALNGNWKKNAVYLIGQLMNFEVNVPQKTRNERAYVNKCYVTKSADPTSTPRFAVINNYGCMLDSLTNPQSKFVPDAKRNKIRFKIGAFVFPGMRTPATQELFMHCEIVIGGPIATPSAKACTFDGQRWKELFGADDACSCCSYKCPAGLQSNAVKIISSEPLSVTKDGQGSLEVGTFRGVKDQPVSPTQKMFEDIWNFSD